MFELNRIVCAVALSLTALTCLGSCGARADSHEAVLEDTVEMMSEVAGIFESITDVESAREAASDLESLKGKAEAIAARMEALGAPDKESERRIMEEYERRTAEVGERMANAMERLFTKPEVMDVLGDSMRAFR